MSFYDDIHGDQRRRPVGRVHSALRTQLHRGSALATGTVHSCFGLRGADGEGKATLRGIPPGPTQPTAGSLDPLGSISRYFDALHRIAAVVVGLARRANERRHRSTWVLTSGASTGLIVVALFVVGLWSASPAKGLAADGQSLDSQPAKVQRTYRAHYGTQAETIWTNLHNWGIGEADACAHVAYTGATTASDDRSLSGESEEIPPLFQQVWGDFDARRWAWEHDCAITPLRTATQTTAAGHRSSTPQPAAPAPTQSAPKPTPEPTTSVGPYQGFGNFDALCEEFLNYDPRVQPHGLLSNGNEYIDHPHALVQCQRAPAD